MITMRELQNRLQELNDALGDISARIRLSKNQLTYIEDQIKHLRKSIKPSKIGTIAKPKAKMTKEPVKDKRRSVYQEIFGDYDYNNSYPKTGIRTLKWGGLTLLVRDRKLAELRKIITEHKLTQIATLESHPSIAPGKGKMHVILLKLPLGFKG